MSYKSIEIKEQRAKVIAQAREVINLADADKRSLSDDEQTKVDELFSQADKMAKDANDAERREKLETAEAELRSSQGRKINSITSVTNPLDKRQASEFMRAWALAGTTGNRPDMNTVTRASEFGFDVSGNTINYRALSKGTTTAGGFTVPQSFSTELEKVLAYYFSVGEAVEMFDTEDGRDYPWPIVDDSGNAGAIVTEASGIGSSTDPAFTQVTFKSWEYYSPIVKVSNQLLRDSARDIPSMLAELFAERMGRALQTACISTNAGSSAPEGMLYNVTAGVNLASGNAITLAKLMDLEASVDIAYRSLPGTGFVMHDATFNAIRQIVDATGGRPLLNPDISTGTEKRLFGYPVFISNSMTSISSPGDNAPLILFGALKKYKVRRVGGSTLTRLNELYAANGQVGFCLAEAFDARWITKAGVKTLNSYDAP